MKKALTLVSKMVLALLVPQLVLAQWAEEQEGQLVNRDRSILFIVCGNATRNSVYIC